MNELLELVVYPIKSLPGISVNSAKVTNRGLEFDRRWMLVDEQGLAYTMREQPRLVLLSVELRDHAIVVSGDPGAITIPLRPESGDSCTVDVFGDKMLSIEPEPEASAWFSDFAGTTLRLVYMPDHSKRPIDPDYATADDDYVSFADGYPILVATDQSLAALNDNVRERGHAEISNRRFRPNVVVASSSPFEEDSWSSLEAGPVELALVKDCGRCSVPSVNPETGVVEKEPLRTLAASRKRGSKTYYGVNAIPVRTGTLSVGQSCSIVRGRQT